MTYYADLSAYRYFSDDRALNIGWLSGEHAFPQGDVPAELLPRLAACLDYPVNQTRGLHSCEFCEDGSAYFKQNNAIGSAEFRIFAEDGTVYAAPTLLHHYIEAHGYKPPQAFVDAVLQCPVPPDPAFRARLDAGGYSYDDVPAFRAKYPQYFT